MGSTLNGLGFTVSGLDQLKKELQVLEPDLKNKLTKTFRDAAKDVRNKARAEVSAESPMRGWKTTPPKKPRSRGGQGWPAWDGSRVIAGIDYKAGVKAPSIGGRTKFFGYRVFNAAPQGNLVEVAGRKSSGRGTGTQFIANLTNKYGSTGRLIYDAFDSQESRINSKVKSELDAIVREYERRLNDNEKA